MDSPLKIAICEDCKTDAQRLVTCICQSGLLAQWDLYESGEALVSGFLPGKYGLIFMDIYLNGIAGVEAAKAVRERDAGVVIAFTTSSEEHTLESYRLGALKYLVKPVSAGDVAEAMRLAEMILRERKTVSLLTGGRRAELPLETILYFEVQDHTVLAHTVSGVLRASQAERLSSLEARLPCPPFLRCHHSYLVNLRHVDRVESDFIMVNGGRARIRQKDFKKLTAYTKVGCLMNWGGRGK